MGLTPRGRRLARLTILPLTLAAWVFCATLGTGRPVHAGQAALPAERSIHLGSGRPGSLYALSLGVKDPAVDQMLDQALMTTDTAAREQIWVGIDRKVMDDAYILPGVWAKGLLYRPPNLTNVFITNGFQMYDYPALGTTRK